MTRIGLNVFYYGCVPLGVIWVLLSLIVIYTYAVKSLHFLCAGSLSLVGATGQAVLVPAPIELAAGCALALVASGFYVLYRYAAVARNYARQEEIPLKSLDASDGTEANLIA